MGGWWPYTLDLARELRPLIHAMRRAGFDAAAVTYQLPAWSDTPRELTVRGRPVRLRGYRTQEPDSITLTDRSGWDCIDLLVVPPAAELGVADLALQLEVGPTVVGHTKSCTTPTEPLRATARPTASAPARRMRWAPPARRRLTPCAQPATGTAAATPAPSLTRPD